MPRLWKKWLYLLEEIRFGKRKSAWLRGLIKAAQGGWIKSSLFGMERGVCVQRRQAARKPLKIEESRLLVKPSNAFNKMAYLVLLCLMFPELLGDSRSSWILLAMSLTASAASPDDRIRTLPPGPSQASACFRVCFYRPCPTPCALLNTHPVVTPICPHQQPVFAHNINVSVL